MDNLKEKLVRVGLTEKEAQVYLALLDSGKTTAYKLATKAGVKISTAYVILENLRKKDLVVKMPDSKKQLFLASDPQFFFNRLARNLHSLESVLPQMQQLSRKREDSSVILYEGYAGIKNALDYKLESMRGKHFLGFYSDLPKPDKKLLDTMIAWSKKCVAQKTGTKVVAPDTPDAQTWVSETIEKYTHGLKLVDKNLWSSEISIEIAGDFIRIIDTKEIQAVIVDNRRVATALKQIFNLVWCGVHEKPHA